MFLFTGPAFIISVLVKTSAKGVGRVAAGTQEWVAGAGGGAWEAGRLAPP